MTDTTGSAPPGPGEPGRTRTPSRFEELVGATVAPLSPIPREAQPFQGHRAGLVTRFVADAIDFGVLVVALIGMYAGVATVQFLINPRGFEFPSPSFARILLVGAVVLWVYLTAAWWLSGRTYGKHVMGLRVVARDGGRMRFVGAALRAAFCVVFPIGLFWVLVSPANRSIQDVVIRSSVVYDWSPRLDQSESVIPPPA